MKRDHLEQRVTRWFAVTLLVLYALVAVGVWTSSRQHGREFAMLALKTETEAVAAYIAASGRLDAPELAEVEREPFPIWIRVSDGERLLAETPGSPDPPRREPSSTEDVTYWRPSGASEPMLVVRHAVGGPVSGLGDRVTVSAIGDIADVRQVELRLGVGLVLLALLVIPFATWVGRLLARRALAPITGLVGEIRALPSDRADRRLAVPERAVSEVAELADAFNDVLGRLHASLETMRRFTEDASHEIRNPLAVMRTGLEVVLRKDRPLVEYRVLLHENLEEIVRLQSILDGLLLLARTEPERRLLVQREPVDLARLAREIGARFAIVAAERRKPVEIDAEGSSVVEGDVRLLHLVVFNLLDNAMTHGAEGRPVRLEVRPEGGTVLLAVESEGPPLTEEARARLFERYDRSGVAGVGGLGLSVVRWAAEVHGGTARYVAIGSRNRFEVEIAGASLRPESSAS